MCSLYLECRRRKQLTDTEQPSDVDATRNVRHFETELHTPGNAIWRPD